jgi:hypothetical protein
MRAALLLISLAVLTGIAILLFKKSTAGTPILVRIQQDGKIGYIDSTGKIVIAPVYFNGSNFSEGLAAVRPNGLYGYIDSKGPLTIQPQFEWAGPFSEGLALAYKNGHFLYINRQGQQAFPANYAKLAPFQHGVAIVQTESNHIGLIDRHGKLLLDTLYAEISDFDEGLAQVNLDRKNDQYKQGIIDTLGHFVIPIGKYRSIGQPLNGYCFIWNDNPDIQLITDRTGKILIKRPYSSLSGIRYEKIENGIMLVALTKHHGADAPGIEYSSENAYAGYIDFQNRLLLDDTTIDYAYPFSNKRAFIHRRDKGLQIIDNHMHPVGNQTYRRMEDPGFVNGYAIVQDDKGNAIIDTNGRVVFRPTGQWTTDLRFLDAHHFVYSNSDHTTTYNIGIIGENKIVTSGLENYESSGFVNGMLNVVIGDTLAVINARGKIIWKDSTHSKARLVPFNTDEMTIAGFSANPTPDRLAKERHAENPDSYHNIPKRIGNRSFGSDTLRLLIDTAVVDTFSGISPGFSVYLANSTKDTCLFNVNDAILYCITQAQTPEGEWKNITYMLSSWCGNSYRKIALEPDAYWQFVMPRYEGMIRVNIRLKLACIDRQHPQKEKILYSNIVKGSINPAQYWNKTTYTAHGIMDPHY